MKRSNFNLSHQKKFTGNMGYIIPITWYETNPGDIIKHSTTALLRMAPLVTPVMHRVFVRIHHFFVPNRLIWDDWKDFYTGGDDGNDDTVHPYLSLPSVGEGNISDYLGVTPGSYSPNLEVSALPYRAYNLIYNEFYRDQDLIPEVAISKGNGSDSTTVTSLRKASWPKDYFTTCRPWEQKGDEVVIPVGGEAPVTGIGAVNQTYNVSSASYYTTDGTDTFANSFRVDGGTNYLNIEEDPNNTGRPNIRANLSAATGIPINDLRLALALQRDMEEKAQYGSRYAEVIAHEFGVRNQDARLQRPEYLGGGKSVIQFSEVLSTDGANTGDLFGHGLAAMKTNTFRRFIPEHGIVMTLMSVLPEPLYTEGIHRSFLRTTKEDYFEKNLQFIGEQEVSYREVQAGHSTPNEIFGYQKRYDEYRYLPSTVAGKMRSTYNTWHYGREFTGDVALNQSFIDCTPTKRTQADTDADSIIVTAHHNIIAKRKMARNPMPRTF